MNKVFLTVLFIFSFSTSYAESGPGNGTDSVKIIFEQAQVELTSELKNVSTSQLPTLGLDSNEISWLLNQKDDNSVPRWSLIKKFLQTMRLDFQYEACTDASKLPASICFFMPEAGSPYVQISLDLNRNTNLEQAKAMLIHEAGHMTGEKNHQFLDQVGINLVQVLRAPAFFEATVDSLITSSQIFIDEKKCQSGEGLQVQQLKEKIIQSISKSCSDRNVMCNLPNIQFTFDGHAVYENGIGYTMKVYCQGHGLLNLKN